MYSLPKNVYRERIDFSKIKTTVPIPNLIEIQKKSYERFLQMNRLPSEREDAGLQSVFKSVFPISDFRENSSLEFIEYSIGNWECKCSKLQGLHHLRKPCSQCGATLIADPYGDREVLCPRCGKGNQARGDVCDICGNTVGLKLKYDVDECQERGMTFAVPLKVTIRLVVWDKDPDTQAKAIRDIKEQEVYFGDIPLMTENGTFIINGTERVIVSQLHRSPGVFFTKESAHTFLAKIIPYRGSWVEFDADVEDVLLVVLELHPGAAVRDDLGQERVRRLLGEEDAGGAVELADDDALGPVDDERAVLGHQRDVAEEDFLFLGIAHVLDAGVGVLVIDEEAEGDLQRDAVGHAALLAFLDGVLHLQVDGIAADVADLDAVLVDHAALLAVDGLFVRVVGDDLRPAVRAGHAQVLEALELAALALPVADGELHEIEGTGLPEIAEGEDAREDRLQAGVLALLGEEVHLQEPLVRAPLNVDEVRQRHVRPDLGEVVADRLLLGHGSVHSDDSFVVVSSSGRARCRRRNALIARGWDRVWE